MRVRLLPLEWQVWPVWYRSAMHGGRVIHLGPVLIEFVPRWEA